MPRDPDLFSEQESRRARERLPLAARMRPRDLDEFVGQSHFLGEGKLLRRMILARRIASVIFYGPPGTGKTTLAHLVARRVDAAFASLNAADAGIKEVREVIAASRDRLAAEGKQTVLFLDEIHHFNRTQQDILLPDVESGALVLVGATTQNPFFAINAPLVSRSQIFQFQPLSIEETLLLLRRAIADPDRGYGRRQIVVSDDALELWATYSDGDARRALTALEIAVLSFPVGGPVEIDLETAADSIQRKAHVHDAAGDDHYDLASAFIKSMRGGDPDAAIYWMARMLEGGEEPRFLARRMVIFASEDVGCADAKALLLAEAAARAVEFVGMPECQWSLAHAAIYLASAPKSRATTQALEAAQKDVAQGRTLPVPDLLRDSHYKGAARLGRGQGYVVAGLDPSADDPPAPHDSPVDAQTYLPSEVRYYHPTDSGEEAAIRRRLQARQTERERDRPPPADHS